MNSNVDKLKNGNLIHSLNEFDNKGTIMFYPEFENEK
jgi:hypothetical protein